MRQIVLIALLLLGLADIAVADAAVRLRVNTTHGLGNARAAVLDAGLSLTSDVIVSASSDSDGHPFLPPDKFLEDGVKAGATILSSSFSGWNYLYDSIMYQRMTEKGVVHVYAYVPRSPQPKNVPPPAAFVTVNMVGGKSGDGIEFGVPTTYMHGKAQSTYSSGVTAQLAGLMACLKRQHRGWNWFDIKAALRMTASNYGTGYDSEKYGYGTIDFHAANRMVDADHLPLFAPAAVVASRRGDLIAFQVNPFRQSRRFSDVLFRFRKPPEVHLKELTLKEIKALGGEFIGSTYLLRSSSIVSCRLSPGDTWYFVWFTMDAQGNYSRIERYSVFGASALSAGKERAGWAPPLLQPHQHALP